MENLKLANACGVSPYLTVENVNEQMDFLVAVFHGTVTENATNSKGQIRHGEVIVSGSVIMVGAASKMFPARQSSNYVYVDNADEVYNRAMESGAQSIMQPADTFYGHREAGFYDRWGNQWWAAHVIEAISKEELHKRTAEI